MLYTSYYGNLRRMPREIEPVSISKITPSEFICSSIPELAPNNYIRKEFKRTHNYTFLCEHYVAQICHFDLPSMFKRFAGKDAVLLCYEKNPMDCHRSVLAAWAKWKFGIDIIEF